MKRSLLILCLLLPAFAISAQPGRFHPEKLSDAEIIQMQTRDIVNWLGLEGTAKDKFVSEYTSFRTEITSVAKNARPPKNMEEESEIDKAIQHNFEISRQILQIREKYYARFKEFMKPSQIQLMYHIENEAGRRMFGGPEGPSGPAGPGNSKDPKHHEDRGGHPLPPPPPGAGSF